GAGGQREKREQEPEGERIRREEERTEGRGGGQQAVDAALSGKCEGGPRGRPAQVDRERERFARRDPAADEQEVAGHDDPAKPEHDGVTDDIRQETAEDRRDDCDRRERRRHVGEAPRPVRGARLPANGFPNDWIATSPSSSRYRRRCETRNGGGAGGAETIRAAPRRARVQRGFDAPTSRPFDQERLSARGNPTEKVCGRTRHADYRFAATSDSRNSRTFANLSTLSRSEEAAKPTRIENALRGRAAKSASSVQSSPAAKMKSQGSPPRRVTKCVPLSAPARRISTTLSPGRTWRSRFAVRVVNTSTRSLAANDPDSASAAR